MMRLSLIAITTALLLPPVATVADDSELPEARQLAYWNAQHWRSSPLSDRIQDGAASEVIDFLRHENTANGFEEIPRQTASSSAFSTDLRAVLTRLPESITRLLEESLTAIILVEDLGSTAFTELVLDDTSEPAAGFIVLDVGRLNRTANSWATYKANTPFSPSEGTSLKALIASPEDDDRSYAIQYILLHETAHVLAAVDGTIHPRWDQALPDASVLEAKYPFTALSWIIEDGEYHRRLEDPGQEPERIRYYAEPDDQISLDRAPVIYEKYLATDFPTLYGATSPYEDFAESFVNYVHTVILGQPYELTIDAEDTVTTYEACWRQPRCNSKRRLLEAWLQQQDVLIK